MATSLSCLCLEVYYRYLPIFKFDNPEERSAPKVSRRTTTRLTESRSVS